MDPKQCLRTANMLPLAHPGDYGWPAAPRLVSDEGAREAPGVVGRASSFANEAHRNPDGDQPGKEFGHCRWVVAGGARPPGPQ